MLQTQVRELQERQCDFVTKKDLEKDQIEKQKLTVYSNYARESEPYVNTKRGGNCLHDSYDSTSGPMCLMTDLVNSTPPNQDENRQSHLSSSYAQVAAANPNESISVAPVKAHMQRAEAHDGYEPARASATRAQSAVAVTSQDHTCDDGVKIQNENDKDGWTQVLRKRNSRFKGSRGTALVNEDTKLKAADVSIPLYIYNVSQENTEQDLADYIHDKTSIIIKPEKVNTKSSRDYSSFKFYIPRSKLSLFTNNELWPQGIYFRRYIQFRKYGKKTADNCKQNEIYGSGQRK